MRLASGRVSHSDLACQTLDSPQPPSSSIQGRNSTTATLKKLRQLCHLEVFQKTQDTRRNHNQRKVFNRNGIFGSGENVALICVSHSKRGHTCSTHPSLGNTSTQGTVTPSLRRASNLRSCLELQMSFGYLSASVASGSPL